MVPSGVFTFSEAIELAGSEAKLLAVPLRLGVSMWHGPFIHLLACVCKTPPILLVLSA
jgi:hypothetical protein